MTIFMRLCQYASIFKKLSKQHHVKYIDMVNNFEIKFVAVKCDF